MFWFMIIYLITSLRSLVCLGEVILAQPIFSLSINTGGSKLRSSILGYEWLLISQKSKVISWNILSRVHSSDMVTWSLMCLRPLSIIRDIRDDVRILPRLLMSLRDMSLNVTCLVIRRHVASCCDLNSGGVTNIRNVIRVKICNAQNMLANQLLWKVSIQCITQIFTWIFGHF